MIYFLFLFRSSNDNPMPYCRSGTRRASNVLPAFDFRPEHLRTFALNVRRTMLYRSASCRTSPRRSCSRNPRRASRHRHHPSRSCSTNTARRSPVLTTGFCRNAGRVRTTHVRRPAAPTVTQAVPLGHLHNTAIAAQAVRISVRKTVSSPPAMFRCRQGSAPIAR